MKHNLFKFSAPFFCWIIAFVFACQVTGLAQIQDRPKPGPELKKLQIWVGDWKYTGTLYDSPFGPGGKFSGRQSVRFILDGLFLESRGEDKGTYGGKPMIYKALTIRWFDASSQTYMEQSFDNDGFASKATTTVVGNTWTIHGTLKDNQGKEYKTRTTSTFSADGKSCQHKGELSSDGGQTWTPYWEDVAKRVRRP